MQYRTDCLYLTTNCSQASRVRKLMRPIKQMLRRQDSNMRPPGYEPGELPTAPHRDIVHFLNRKHTKLYFDSIMENV